jgi:hypothetical protein
MAVDPEDANLVKKLLFDGEGVELTVKQRRVGPGGSVITPTSVVATNMRIIIVNRATLGIRKDYEAIPYKQIASVRLENGIISSSVFIRVQGYDTDKGLLKNGRQEGEIDGLRNKDAVALSSFISKKISPTVGDAGKDPDSGTGGHRYCTNCGAEYEEGTKFCSRCGAKLSAE